MKIFETPFTIFTLLSDRYCRLTVPAMAQIFQEVAEMHSTATGIGYHDLIKDDHIWVLSRVSYRVLNRFPRLDENVKVRTWSKCSDGLMAQREFEILSGMNEVLVAGTSMWVILNIKTRRVERLDQEIMSHYPHHDQAALGFVSPRLRLSQELAEVRRFNVEFSSIDKAQHVNNAEYIRWMMNLLPEEVQKDGILGLDINYVLETHPGEEVVISMAQEAGDYVFQIRNPRGVSVNAVFKV